MISVGRPWPLGPVANGLGFYIAEHSGVLALYSIPNPTKQEIAGFKGNLTIGAKPWPTQNPRAIAWWLDGALCGPGGIDGFSAWLQGEEPPLLETPEDGYGISISLTLIDSTTNIVHAIRTLGVSTEFTKVIHRTCQQIRHAGPSTPNQIKTLARNLYRQYPTNEIFDQNVDVKYTAGTP